MRTILNELASNTPCLKLVSLGTERRRYWLTRGLLVSLVLLFASSISALADNVGFCPPPATVTACTTANGLSNDTIKVGTTSFGMWSAGSKNSTSTWYLLLSVPEMAPGKASAPTLTSTSFVQLGTTKDAGAFTQSTSGSIYSFAQTAGDIPSTLGSNSSMNASNLFCDGAGIPCTTSNEIAAFGKLPKDFEVFVYTFRGAIQGSTAYEFSASSPLASGTYLAALAVGSSKGKKGGNIQFSTPFTTTGLATATTPEPNSLLLFSSGLFGLAGLVRRKLSRA